MDGTRRCLRRLTTTGAAASALPTLRSGRVFVALFRMTPAARDMPIGLKHIEREPMRDIILWLAGVPIFIIVLLHLTGFLR